MAIPLFPTAPPYEQHWYSWTEDDGVWYLICACELRAEGNNFNAARKILRRKHTRDETVSSDDQVPEKSDT